MHQNVIPSLRVAVPSHREEGYVIPYPYPRKLSLRINLQASPRQKVARLLSTGLIVSFVPGFYANDIKILQFIFYAIFICLQSFEFYS